MNIKLACFKQLFLIFCFNFIIGLFVFSQNNTVSGQLNKPSKFEYQTESIEIRLFKFPDSINVTYPEKTISKMDSLDSFIKQHIKASNEIVPIKEGINTSGRFSFETLPNGRYKLVVYQDGIPKLNLETITLLTNETIKLTIDYPRKHIKKGDKSCPICNKKNGVIPVRYGPPSNKTIGTQKKEKVKLIGCLRLDLGPKWFCTTDSLYF